MLEAKHTPEFNRFVHVSAKRSANPGIVFQWPDGEIPSRMAIARQQAAGTTPAQTELARDEAIAYELDVMRKDFNRTTLITDDLLTFSQKMDAFLLAQSANPKYLPPSYKQTDFTSGLDLQPFVYGCMGLGFPLDSDDLSQCADRARNFARYTYLRRDNSGQQRLAGVAIGYGWPMVIDEQDVSACLGISVVDYPEDGTPFYDANVNFFFDAVSAEKVQVEESAQEAKTASPRPVKTAMDRRTMLKKLEKVIGNEQVFQLIQYHMNHPREMTTERGEQSWPFGIRPAPKEVTETPGLPVPLIKQYQCIRLAKYLKQLRKANQPFDKLAWGIGIGITVLVLFIASLPLTYFWADPSVFSGFASTGLGVAIGSAVLGLPFSLYHLCKWAKFTWRECVVLFVSAVGVILAFELPKESPFSFVSSMIGLIGDMQDIMSSAAPYGYIAFGITAVLTMVGLIVSACKMQQASGVESEHASVITPSMPTFTAPATVAIPSLTPSAGRPIPAATLTPSTE